MKRNIKLFRNLSLVQNIIISLNYIFMLFIFIVLWASVEGLFDTIEAQRQGEIDDVLGWAILFEGASGFLGAFALVILGCILIVATIYMIVMWLMFWKANRQTRPFCRRRPWGIADQICKALLGALWLQGTTKDFFELVVTDPAGGKAIPAAAFQVCIALFLCISGIFLFVRLCAAREKPPETVTGDVREL